MIDDSRIAITGAAGTLEQATAGPATTQGADFSEWVSLEKFAEVICFLASGDAGTVPGALLPVRRTGLAVETQKSGM